MSETYLVYVDDSGDNDYRLYSAVFINIRNWSSCLGTWLAFRRRLEAEYEIPLLYEIHAGKFFAGRGRPSINPEHPVNTDRRLRRAIGTQGLELIGGLDNVRTLTVAREGNSVRPAYDGLLDEVQTVLIEQDAFGILIVDGEDTDVTYWAAHRDLKLADRRVVEDPWMQASHASQLVQIADLVAYAAHQHITRPAGRAEMADWYLDHITQTAHADDIPDGIVWLEK